MKQTRAFLLSKKVVGQDIYHLFFYVAGEGLEFAPGQYAILTIPASPSPLKRLYSFAGSNNNKNVFELLIKLIPGGVASEYVRNLRVGDVVDVGGPAGLFLQQKTTKRKVFMATGTGFAPIRSFLLSSLPQTLNGSLFWGLRDVAEAYLFDELLLLTRLSPTFSFTYCLSQQASFDSIPANLLHYFRAGHIDTVWTSQTPVVDSNSEYYLCGSRTVVDHLRTLLLAKGVSRDSLFFEKY